MRKRLEDDLTILFLGKKNDKFCEKALVYCRSHSDSVMPLLGEWGQPLPDVAKRWEGDLIISYLSRWVVPEAILNRARIAAINFHPASPDYPGIGCINFALYDNIQEYGATCHYMKPQVDTGNIISVRRFPVERGDSVETLLSKTYKQQYKLFTEIMDILFSGRELPGSEEIWTRKPYTRQEFNDLMTITPDMDRDEIARRVRATSFREWQPIVKIGGYTFKLVK